MRVLRRVLASAVVILVAGPTPLLDATVERNRGAVVTEYAWSAGNCNPCPGPTLSSADIATLGADATGGHLDESSITLTPLRARYTKESLGQDLVFRVALPITGHREAYSVQEQAHGATPSRYGNNFQARDAIRHGWTAAVACNALLAGGAGGALGLAFVPRGKLTLGVLVARVALVRRSRR